MDIKLGKSRRFVHNDGYIITQNFLLLYRGIKMEGDLDQYKNGWSAYCSLTIAGYKRGTNVPRHYVNKYKALKAISRSARVLVNESYRKNFANFTFK